MQSAFYLIFGFLFLRQAKPRALFHGGGGLATTMLECGTAFARSHRAVDKVLVCAFMQGKKEGMLQTM